MNFHTDLAMERHALCACKHSKNITIHKVKREKVQLTEIEILNAEGAEELQKPKGTYITVEVPEFSHESELLDGRLTALVESIRRLLPKNFSSALIAGLGNENITPDALGPKTVHHVFATRHIETKLAIQLGLGELQPVSAISLGVLGQTGIETAELISSIAKDIQPDVIITIDALAARSKNRLGNTVQLTDTGLTPGSGVGNHRQEINTKSMGVPVIAIGIPTVIDVDSVLEEANCTFAQNEVSASSMMLCPRDIDTIILRASKLLGLALNCALQPALSPQDLLALL